MHGRNGEILLRKEESDKLLWEGDSGFAQRKEGWDKWADQKTNRGLKT